jgi:uncharacterized protein (TIGR00297 family)
MAFSMVNFIIGMTAGVGIAYLAHRAHALNRSGAMAAGVLGTIVFGLGGLSWALVLLTFFISSSGLSKFFSAKKAHAGQEFAKGSNRDAGQVAANGAVAGLLTLGFVMLGLQFPGNDGISRFWVGFAASLAGANADTWATELGVLNPRHPILLTTFRRVPQGTSGGVSLVGSLAALSGAALVGLVVILVGGLGWAPGVDHPPWLLFIIITAAGFLGSFVDSFLGATLQAVYYCSACEKQTEKHPVHTCGGVTVQERGLNWLTNDWVNFACTLSGALVGMTMLLLF